jgi:hypothetical protein
VLLRKEYFSYQENAEEYVTKITLQIENDLHFTKCDKTPKKLLRFGNFYSKFKGSHRSTWYVFFNKKDSRYFVKFVTNNHMETASFINIL